MANVVKKYTISSELAQKMVNEAMAQIKDYVAFYPDRVDEIS